MDLQSLANANEDAVSGPGAARAVHSQEGQEGGRLKGFDGR
jgi:hypothetical protein